MESRLIAPVVSTVIPAVPASILMPPAAFDALIVTALASASPAFRLIEPAVLVTSMSSPAAPAAVISTPPADAFNTMASDTSSVEVRLIDEPVADISISSPAAAPDAKISIPPAAETIFIESAAFSLAVRLIDVLDVRSKSSPAAAPPTAISIPPADDLTCIASAPVPVDFSTRLESVAPSNLISKSSASASVVEVILEAPPVTSIESVPAVSIVRLPDASISNVLESISIATSASVPILIPVDPSKERAPAFASISTAPSATTTKLAAPAAASTVVIVRLPFEPTSNLA